MIREYRFTCTDCAACAEPEDCIQCGELLEEMLLRLICVSGVDVDMGAGRLCIETDGSDEAALAEVLEDAGIAIQRDSGSERKEDRQEEKQW